MRIEIITKLYFASALAVICVI